MNSFFIVVLDKDESLFSVHGPMPDDSWINEKVVEAQGEGRSINCFSSVADKTRTALIQKCRDEFGFEYSEESVL